MQVLQLKAGRLLLFRGDMVHAGGAYNDLNFRLHFYLDHIHCDRALNATQYIEDDDKLVKIKW